MKFALIGEPAVPAPPEELGRYLVEFSRPETRTNDDVKNRCGALGALRGRGFLNHEEAEYTVIRSDAGCNVEPVIKGNRVGKRQYFCKAYHAWLGHNAALFCLQPRSFGETAPTGPTGMTETIWLGEVVIASTKLEAPRS